MLLSGHNLKLAVVGGSVSTWGASQQQYLWPRQVHKWLQHAADDCHQEDGAARHHGSPHLAVADTYAADQTVCGGHSKVEMVDLSYPGITAEYADQCIVQRVPQDADIVFFEL